jgi:Formyl transferase, C-terminal domain
MRQADRAIDWMRDRTARIVRKIRATDSAPGVLGTLLGKSCFLYGAHEEERRHGVPRQILARRDGAICIGTVDGAVWISHLKAKNDTTAQEVTSHLAQVGVGHPIRQGAYAEVLRRVPKDPGLQFLYLWPASHTNRPAIHNRQGQKPPSPVNACPASAC